MNKMPFVKKFKIDSNFYVYDVNSNSFFQVDEPVYFLIDNDINGSSDILKEYTKDAIRKAQKNISMIKKRGYFSNQRPTITYFHSQSKEEFFRDLREILDKKLSRISLVVTENCNMRCRYCAYSGQYIYHRKHNEKNMSSEVMKKAVDFYFSHSKANEQKNISFYGGEPLLNFKLIKKCVEYIREKYSQKVEFNMTVNGTLLSKERIEFLAENNFSLLISLDGPKKIHDRNRIFKNGEGTFDCIVKNLRAMKSMYPEYYKKKVRFNMVLAPPLDFDSLNEFISTTDIKPAAIKFSDVSSRFTTFFSQFDSNQLKEFNCIWNDLLDSFDHKLALGQEPNEVEKNMFRHRFLYIHKRDMEKIPAKYPSHGQCMIGTRTVLINIDGTFNFCTQVDDVFNLGNVYSGFDYKGIEKIYLALENFLAERCYDCWAIRFCMKCIKEINKNGELDEETFELMCKEKERSILNKIKDYIKIREQNYHALDYLKDVTVS